MMVDIHYEDLALLTAALGHVKQVSRVKRLRRQLRKSLHNQHLAFPRLAMERISFWADWLKGKVLSRPVVKVRR